MSLRDFIEQARQAGYLVEIHREVSPHLELARVAAALDGRPVLFHRVTGSKFPVIVGAGSAREYYARTCGVSADRLLPALANALEHPRPPEIVESGARRRPRGTGPNRFGAGAGSLSPYTLGAPLEGGVP